MTPSKKKGPGEGRLGQRKVKKYSSPGSLPRQTIHLSRLVAKLWNFFGLGSRAMLTLRQQ